MSTDLVARLREDADCAPGRLHQSLWDAADEIERLRERNAWLENYVNACDNEIQRARSAHTRGDE